MGHGDDLRLTDGDLYTLIGMLQANLELANRQKAAKDMKIEDLFGRNGELHDQLLKSEQQVANLIRERDDAVAREALTMAELTKGKPKRK